MQFLAPFHSRDVIDLRLHPAFFMVKWKKKLGKVAFPVSDCIFCKIVNGDIPAAKVYEDEHVLAFLDISQVTKGHTLVIPKVHKENIFELTPDVASHVFTVVPKIANAIKKQFAPIGLNLLNNNGEQAGQTVFHYHVHLIPRYGKGDGFGAVWKSHASDYTFDDLQTIASTIQKGLS
jgi:histidine triad (HIT) family protein